MREGARSWGLGAVLPSSYSPYSYLVDSEFPSPSSQLLAPSSLIDPTPNPDRFGRRGRIGLDSRLDPHGEGDLAVQRQRIGSPPAFDGERGSFLLPVPGTKLGAEVRVRHRQLP